MSAQRAGVRTKAQGNAARRQHTQNVSLLMRAITPRLLPREMPLSNCKRSRPVRRHSSGATGIQTSLRRMNENVQGGS